MDIFGDEFSGQRMIGGIGDLPPFPLVVLPSIYRRTLLVSVKIAATMAVSYCTDVSVQANSTIIRYMCAGNGAKFWIESILKTSFGIFIFTCNSDAELTCTGSWTARNAQLISPFPLCTCKLRHGLHLGCFRGYRRVSGL